MDQSSVCSYFECGCACGSVRGLTELASLRASLAIIVSRSYTALITDHQRVSPSTHLDITPTGSPARWLRHTHHIRNILASYCSCRHTFVTVRDTVRELQPSHGSISFHETHCQPKQRIISGQLVFLVPFNVF
jgi:hypothetical protein